MSTILFDKIITVIGNSGSGKTLLIEKLIHRLTAEKIRLAVFKHTHHKNFQLDFKGKDTYRYFTAGAKNISILSDYKCALLRWIESKQPLNICKIIETYFPDVDIVLIEGMRKSNFNKILVVRKLSDVSKLDKRIDKILCIVISGNGLKNYDKLHNNKIPLFKMNDIDKILNFLKVKLKL